MEYALLVNPSTKQPTEIAHIQVVDAKSTNQTSLYSFCVKDGKAVMSLESLSRTNLDKIGYPQENIYDNPRLIASRSQGIDEVVGELSRPLDVREVSVSEWHSHLKSNHLEKVIYFSPGATIREVSLINGKLGKDGKGLLNAKAIESRFSDIPGKTILHIKTEDSNPLITIMDVLHIGDISLRSVPFSERLELIDVLIGQEANPLFAISDSFEYGQYEATSEAEAEGLGYGAYEHGEFLLSFTLGFDRFEGPHYRIIDPTLRVACRILTKRNEEGTFYYGLGLRDSSEEEVFIGTAKSFNEYEEDDLVSAWGYSPMNTLSGSYVRFEYEPFLEEVLPSYESASSCYMP